MTRACFETLEAKLITALNKILIAGSELHRRVADSDCSRRPEGPVHIGTADVDDGAQSLQDKVLSTTLCDQ